MPQPGVFPGEPATVLQQLLLAQPWLLAQGIAVAAWAAVGATIVATKAPAAAIPNLAKLLPAWRREMDAGITYIASRSPAFASFSSVNPIA